MTDDTADQAAAHLDLDMLADALAGEGEDAATTHLAGCASCTSRLAELDAADRRVRTALATLPPPALPPELADRLTAAVAGQPPLASTSATVTALPARTPRQAWLPAAAAAVLLTTAGGLGYGLVSGAGGGDGGEAADTTAGAAAPALVLNASATDYSDVAAVEAVLPRVLAGAAGTAALEAAPVPQAARSTAESADPAGTTSMQAPVPAAPVPDPLARLRTPEGLADCLAALLPPEEPDVQPRALDYAQYEGQPALAVLLPDPDPAKLSVFVVGPGCSRTDDSTLHFFRVDAP